MKNGHRAIDATRMSDGTFVMLKLIPADNLKELDIARYLSTKPLASDARNHCVPVLDVLHLPDPQDGCLLVMPLLREFNSPRFETFGEVIAFFNQLLLVSCVLLVWSFAL